MFDIHSHILPGIDDGSKTKECSEKHLESLKSAGFSGVAFTPHFYPSRMKIESFLEEREKAYGVISSAVSKSGLEVSCGAEVYLSTALFNDEKIERLCYTGTKTLLVEPEYGDKFTSEIDRKFSKLVNDFSDITPIVAHIDRFPYILNDAKIMDYLAEMGYLFQINLDSLGGFFERKKIYRAIENGLISFVGNDLHQDMLQVKKTKESLEKLEKTFGKGFAEYLDEKIKEYIMPQGNENRG